MTKPKRRSHPAGATRIVFVEAIQDLRARTVVSSIYDTSPSSYEIRKGTLGIVRGPAPGAPDLTAVEFEWELSKTVCVEISPEDISIVK